jgi:hypothetical protein
MNPNNNPMAAIFEFTSLKRSIDINNSENPAVTM